MSAGENPKQRFGAQKPSLHLIPGAALSLIALAMEDGADKYGLFNFRDKEHPVRAMTYLGANLRHVMNAIDGEDFTADTAVMNVAAAAASLIIYLDALCTGSLVDDRPLKGKSSEIQEMCRNWKAAKAEGENPQEAAKRIFAPLLGVAHPEEPSIVQQEHLPGYVDAPAPGSFGANLLRIQEAAGGGFGYPDETPALPRVEVGQVWLGKAYGKCVRVVEIRDASGPGAERAVVYTYENSTRDVLWEDLFRVHFERVT